MKPRKNPLKISIIMTTNNVLHSNLHQPPVHLLEAEAVHCLQVEVDHHEEVGLGAGAGHRLDVVQGVH